MTYIYASGINSFADANVGDDKVNKEFWGQNDRTEIPERFKRSGIRVRPVGRAYLEGSTPQAVFSATSLPLRPHKTNIKLKSLYYRFSSSVRALINMYSRFTEWNLICPRSLFRS